MLLRLKLYKLGALIITVSFIGFWIENIWLAFTKGYMNNRNMNMPFLLGYGLAIVAIYMLFGTPSKMIFFGKYEVTSAVWTRFLMYFLCVMFCVSVGEIVLGTITEKLCHINYWDYSRLSLHITRYTSVPTSMGFAAIIVIFMEYVLPPLMKFICMVDCPAARLLVFVLCVLLLADFIFCYGRMMKTHSFYDKWKLPIKKMAITCIR